MPTTTAIPPKAQILLNRQILVENQLSELEAILSKAEKGPSGLVLESSKTTEWKVAKELHASVWQHYREINKLLSKMRVAVGYEAVNGKRVTIYQYK